eukprot:XP_011425273.1 PREDICTED: mucin-17-like isoform X1 [Crassostrea gigas]
MLDDTNPNDLTDLVDVFVNEVISSTSSPLSGTSELTNGNPGQKVKVKVVFKDKNEESPVGRISVTTQNAEKVIFILRKPNGATITREKPVRNPSAEQTVETDFAEELATDVEIIFFPARISSIVFVKDLRIKTCIEMVGTTTLPSVQIPSTTPLSGLPSGFTSTQQGPITPTSCPVPMLDDTNPNDLADLVDVFVNQVISSTSSPLSGTSEPTNGNPGQEVKVKVVFKDKDDESPVGKISVTTQNAEKVIFILTQPNGTTVTKEKTVQNPSEESTVDEDFVGEPASTVEIQLVPVDETSTVSVKDLGIKACIERVGTTTLPSVQTPSTTPLSGPPSGSTSTPQGTTTPISCAVPMLDDTNPNDLADLVDVFVNQVISSTSSPLSGTSEPTNGNPGQEVKVKVVFKDKDDESPVGKISVTTQNAEKVIFILTQPNGTTVTKEKTVKNPSEESTVDEDFLGEPASTVDIQLVPMDETSTVSMKDLGIKACIEKGTSHIIIFSSPRQSQGEVLLYLRRRRRCSDLVKVFVAGPVSILLLVVSSLNLY